MKERNVITVAPQLLGGVPHWSPANRVPRCRKEQTT
eukprot:COSAG06_NODE_62611_length_264_cov_1.145455_1_plen_35_part_10